MSIGQGMKTILVVHPHQGDDSSVIEFLGGTATIRRVGCNGDFEGARRLVAEHDGPAEDFWPEARERLGLEAIPFPFKMTTICFVGPSAYVPVHSAMTLFPEEFDALVTKREVRSTIPVTAAPAGGE